jgi:hypothetical protein
MEPVRARFFRAMNLGFEMGEISGEDGRSDEGHRVNGES